MTSNEIFFTVLAVWAAIGAFLIALNMETELVSRVFGCDDDFDTHVLSAIWPLTLIVLAVIAAVIVPIAGMRLAIRGTVGGIRGIRRLVRRSSIPKAIPKATLLGLILLLACAPVVVRQPERPAWQYVLDVMAAVSHPPACQIRDLPERVVLHFFVDDASEDPFRRAFVIKRELQDKLEEQDEIRRVVQDLLTCVRRLSVDSGSP